MNKYYCLKCRKEIGYNSFHYGSGLCGSCSLSGRKQNKEHIAKRAKANTGKKRTKTQREKMSIAHKGIKLGAMSEEHKRKIGKANNGQKRTKEQRERMSKAQKNIKHKPLSKEHKAKISKAKIGKKRGPLSEEHKAKISKGKKGKKYPPRSKQHIEKLRQANKGKKRSKESCENISKATKGKNNPNYIHGQGYGTYSKEFTPFLRKSIRERDNNICQCCGMTQKEHYKKWNRNIEIHHIDYCTFNCDKDKLITLCRKCNMRANKNRDYWFAFYTYIMENRK